MAGGLEHRQSKERHEKWSKKASERRSKKNNVITYGDALAQILAKGEQVGNLPLYRVLRKAAKVLGATNWK